MFFIYVAYNIHNFINLSYSFFLIPFQNVKALAYFIPLPIDYFPHICFHPFPLFGTVSHVIAAILT